jgi:hypothetical protein
MQYGYMDSSISTSIIDLFEDERELWSNLRKSYKSLINRGKKAFNLSIIDHNNPDVKSHEIYRELHHKTAGKVTRKKETFDVQFEMLKKDKAALICLQEDGKYIAFSYFLHHNERVYYGSACNDNDHESDVPFEHYIIWAAIDYYKKRNFQSLELGWQQYGPQLFDHPDAKDINISFFKRGFGGKIISQYRGIKYYDKDYMTKELQLHKELLINRF